MSLHSASVTLFAKILLGCFFLPAIPEFRKQGVDKSICQIGTELAARRKPTRGAP
ncbi:hypothetical protein AA0473_1722 [Acetobacter orleanensis NRIC 0473]|uniref:Uncharacterized protein n=1 Tax=Acetobacter orleanensis TaxID=104099 RepID=A0A4Y3TIM6_9PROT|nr:hypothetical protein Abol_030_074 [Acetobacter orleanensis JCM 7639]GBR28352.1 hypothetical protein AA0473_1722 [Acetobacter orleanensis NRIC 0473]GEB82166.1 hypothetical protein AOR01nite_06430 [Acetobacter orleanensis]